MKVSTKSFILSSLLFLFPCPCLAGSGGGVDSGGTIPPACSPTTPPLEEDASSSGDPGSNGQGRGAPDDPESNGQGRGGGGNRELFQAVYPSEECLNIKYTLSLHVTYHLFLVGKPTTKQNNVLRGGASISASSDSQAPGSACPVLIFHERTDFGKVFHEPISEEEKEVVVGGQQLQKEEDDGFAIGQYTLKNLIEAFETVEPSGLTTSYNLISNNCATFILRMANALDYNIMKKKEDIVAFTADRLLVNGATIGILRENPRLLEELIVGSTIDDDNNKDDDKDLLELLVSSYIENHNKMMAGNQAIGG